jgi:hypothetical protein
LVLRGDMLTALAYSDFAMYFEDHVSLAACVDGFDGGSVFSANQLADALRL